MKAILSIALLATASFAIAQTTDNMRAFPPAEKGMTRHVIRLSQEKDEAALKVEIIVGKTVRTDAQNRYFFGTSKPRTFPDGGMIATSFANSAPWLGP